MKDMSDTLRSTFRRVLRLENRRAAIRPGRLEYIPDFHSKILDGTRMLTVYLPPGYDERDGRRYPVLYMHDGQNLFDADRAYVPGNHWRLQEATDAAINDRTAEPLIIVGIDHGGVARLDEYTPVRSAKHNGGGRADDHARMLIEELKPMIDARYRTVPADAGVGGSSLGGLVSLYVALKHPDVFTRAAVMSPSVWWGDRAILDEVDRFEGHAQPRMWLDIGGREGYEALADARALRARLIENGWNDDTLRYFEDRRADHSERAWAKRARMPLEFLFPQS
jgi:predicted alpha/beta superfamily hydrolase